MKINKLTNGSKALLAGGLLCCLALAGCFREDLVPGKEGTPDEARTYGLGFTIAADALTKATDGERGSMQYGNEIENYIDPTQLRVLFLDKDGNFQYEFSQMTYEERDKNGILIEDLKEKRLKSGLHLEPLRLNHDGGAVSQWFARIPIDQLSDEQLKLITDEGFKIAIMANWPKETFYGEDNDAHGSIYTNFLDGGEQNLANRLAHCHYDEKYVEDTNDESGIFNAYKPFLGVNARYEGGNEINEEFFNQLSVWSDWVTTQFEEKKKDEDRETKYTQFEAAEEWIRAKYDPYPVEDVNGVRPRPSLEGKSGRTYYDMWYVWNFGGSYNNKYFYDKAPGENTYYHGTPREKWAQRNDEKGWASQWKESIENGLGEQTITLSNGSFDGLTFVSASAGSGEATLVETDYGIGVKMPTAFSTGDHEEDPVAKDKYGKIVGSGKAHFKVSLAADGFLRLKVGAISDSDEPKVAVGLYFAASDEKDKQQITYPVDGNFGDKTVANEFTFTVRVNANAENAYIYALSDDPKDQLVIYEIEYFKSWHLSDIERDGIRVSKKNPIPMYGIQDFDPIGAYWVPGELFNLSANNGLHPDNRYNYRWISLLRSVAKVELKIAKAPFGGKKPAYVYMRSMNRSARLNPIDVLTPTNQLWYGDAEHNLVGIVQETANIQTYGPIYEGKDGDNSREHFHQRLAWFFGVWTHEKVGINAQFSTESGKWNWNGFDYINAGIDKSIPYPRVFNPHINRSDYTHFIDTDPDGTDTEYWHYMLYVPEKGLTDVNNPGDVTEAPKCLHVELRWEDLNSDDNLDNNAAYRIYFADPTKNGQLVGSFGRDKYKEYERDVNNVRTFFPIVRNHLYQVTVSGINQGDINYTVNNPAEREVNIEFE